MPRTRRPEPPSVLTLGIVALALALSNCGGEPAGDGRLDIDLAGAAPPDTVREAWLEFSGITVERSDGTRVQLGFDKPRRIDLAKLTDGGSTPLLHDAKLPAGHYDWLHLHLNTRGKKDTYLVLGDETIRELMIPSDDRDHLRVANPFDVPAGGTASRTIEFELRSPLREEGPTKATYGLTPALRSVATDQAGHIEVTASRELVAQHCREPHRDGLALYVFPEGVTPDDLDGDYAEPLSVDPAIFGDDDEPIRFRASFLPPGQYTIALTCNADNDRASSDDPIAFFQRDKIATRAGETVSRAFDPPRGR